MTQRHLFIATAAIVMALAIGTTLILRALNTLDLDVQAVIGAVEQSH